ncbi:MAG: hypothetical protein QM586_04945 [Xenophilus sp.]
MNPSEYPGAMAACAELDALRAELGDQAHTDPRHSYWWRRLLWALPAHEVGRFARAAVDVGNLPRPHAYTVNGQPLFTFEQIALALGVEIGGLQRAAARLPEAGGAPN